MKEVSLLSYAKVNLFLNVLYKRPNGYHNIETVMQSIDLADKIRIGAIDKAGSIKIICDNQDVPCNENNLAYKAAKIIMRKARIKRKIEINIKKKIPVASGLGGGSSNACATIIGLNKIFGLNYKSEELKNIASEVGSDVPYFLYGGTALVGNKGDKIKPIAPLPPLFFVLSKPNFSISTRWAYNRLSKGLPNNLMPISNLIKSIEEKNIEKILKNLYNVFENVIIAKHPEVGKLKQNLLNLGARGVLMSGSGPTVFGIFDDQRCAKEAKETLSNNYRETFLAKTVNSGVKYIKQFTR